MRKMLRIALAVVSLTVVLASTTSPAQAAPNTKDPPLRLSLASASAPITPTGPGAVVVAGSFVNRPATRIYYRPELAVPNTACWKTVPALSITFVNRWGSRAAEPWLKVEWCYRNYVFLSGTTWSCGSDDGYLHEENDCTADWGAAGHATRDVDVDWDYGIAVSGWFGINIDVDLSAKFGPGWETGTWTWNGAG